MQFPTNGAWCVEPQRHELLEGHQVLRTVGWWWKPVRHTCAVRCRYQHRNPWLQTYGYQMVSTWLLAASQWVNVARYGSISTKQMLHGSQQFDWCTGDSLTAVHAGESRVNLSCGRGIVLRILVHLSCACWGIEKKRTINNKDQCCCCLWLFMMPKVWGVVYHQQDPLMF